MIATRLAVIPTSAFMRGLEPADIAVLALLSTLANENGWCAPSARAIGDQLKRSQPWATAALGRLETAGAIVAEKHGRQLARFRIVYDPPPNQPADIGNQPADIAAPVAHGPQISPLISRNQPADTTHVVKRRKSAVDDLDLDQPADIDQKPPSLSTSTKHQEKGKREGARKARLSAGWQPDDALRAWAAAERPDLDLDLTVASFVDYWIGRGEPMADWTRTFRNWVRREKPGNGRSRGGGTGGGPGPDTLNPDQRLRAAAARAVAPRLGPDPGAAASVAH